MASSAGGASASASTFAVTVSWKGRRETFNVRAGLRFDALATRVKKTFHITKGATLGFIFNDEVYSGATTLGSAGVRKNATMSAFEYYTKPTRRRTAPSAYRTAPSA